MSARSKFDEMVVSYAKLFRVTPRSGQALVRAVLDRVAALSLSGTKVRTPIGIFFKKTRKARRIRNPATSELMKLKAVTSLGFRAAKRLRGAR